MLVQTPQPTPASRDRRQQRSLVRTSRPRFSERLSSRGRAGGVILAATRLLGLAAGAALIAASTSTSAFASVRHASSPAKHRPARIFAASAFGLPASKQCVGGRALTLQVRTLADVTWIGATVKVNGKRFKTIKRSQITRPVKLTRLPTGTFVLSITAKTSDGRSVTTTRTYHTCAMKHVKPSVISPGGYNGNGPSFYVSADGKQVQDVTLYAGLDNLGCTPGGRFQDSTFDIPSIAIAPGGSFTGTATQTGVVDNSPATYTYTVSGHFRGTTATGTWRDEITYNNGAAYSCTSNTQSWSATRSAQGTQTASPSPPGSYAGNGPSFYVSADGKQVQDVTLYAGLDNLGCTPGGRFQDSTFNIPSIAIAADGSFTGTATQTGVIDNSPATFTYTFSGHFHGTDASGDERAAGTWRENITYNNGTACTSNTNPWSATRSAQGTQIASPPQPGSYAGSGSSFSVSPDSAQLQDVTLYAGLDNLGCTPSGRFQDSTFNIPSMAIAADGSFAGTATQTGVEDGSPATFTYTFSGHFHGTDASGDERAAGTWRENITYNRGTAYTCTSNTNPWSATRSGS